MPIGNATPWCGSSSPNRKATDAASPHQKLRRAAARSGSTAPGVRRGRLPAGSIDAIAKLFASAKEQAAFGLHRDDLAGLRVTALISLIILDVKRAEPPNLDVLAPTERFLHRLEDGLYRRLGLLLRNAAFRNEDIDQVGLEHSLFSRRR